MKITRRQLRSLIVEALGESLHEAFGLRHVVLGPAMGTIYGAMKGKKEPEPKTDFDSNPYKPGYEPKPAMQRLSSEEQERRSERKRLRREEDREAANRIAMQKIKAYPEIVSKRLSSQYGLAANPNQYDGINIKYKGEIYRISVDSDMSIEDAVNDAFQQVVDIDPELEIRSNASKRRMRRGEESIVVDDDMMEGLSRGSLYRKRYYGRY